MKDVRKEKQGYTKDIVTEELERRGAELLELRKQVQRSLKNAPEGTLRAAHNRNQIQYYVKTPENAGQYPRGKYVKRADQEIVKKISQRDYDKSVLAEVEREIAAIHRFLEDYQPKKIAECYEKTTPYRRQWIRSWTQTQEEYVKEWMSVPFVGKHFEEGTQEIYTEKGERVRSKSEKIIADKLFLCGIPYKYECPLALPKLGKIYPDFTCLNMRTRKEIRWEHFGMMGQAEYCKKALKKIEAYTEAGYDIGEKLIVTYEMADYVLNMGVVEKLIEKYLV